MSERSPVQASGIGEAITPTDLFPTRLPSSVAMWLSVFLILLFGAAAAAVVFVKVPDTIRCPFVLVPEGGDDPVQATRDGTLVGILVSDTQTVRKGEDLFVIRSQQIRNWTGELETLEQDQQAGGRRAALLEQDFKAALEIQATRLQQFEKDLVFQQEYFDTLRDFLQRYETLDTEGLVPRVDIMSQRLASSRAERDVTMTRQSRDMAVLDADRLRTDHRKQLDELELERRKNDLRIATLRKLLDGAREDVIRVTAPYDGTVVAVLKKNSGDAVSAGQELCRIARSDSALVAEVSPPEAGVQRARVGGAVQLFYDAYPYQRFGSGRGTVTWISPGAVTTPEGQGFRMRVALDAQTLGRPAGDRPFRAGMRGEARLLTGRRTLLEFVFQPLRQLRETFGARP
jgi:membrane fusion protein